MRSSVSWAGALFVPAHSATLGVRSRAEPGPRLKSTSLGPRAFSESCKGPPVMPAGTQPSSAVKTPLERNLKFGSQAAYSPEGPPQLSGRTRAFRTCCERLQHATSQYRREGDDEMILDLDPPVQKPGGAPGAQLPNHLCPREPPCALPLAKFSMFLLPPSEEMANGGTREPARAGHGCRSMHERQRGSGVHGRIQLLGGGGTWTPRSPAAMVRAICSGKGWRAKDACSVMITPYPTRQSSARSRSMRISVSASPLRSGGGIPPRRRGVHTCASCARSPILGMPPGTTTRQRIHAAGDRGCHMLSGTAAPGWIQARCLRPVAAPSAR